MLTWLGLAIAAYMTSLLIGRRKTLYLIGLVALVASISTLQRLGRRTYRHFNPPFARVGLSLELARRQWRVGEKPWYTLRLTNRGNIRVRFEDAFWNLKERLDHNTIQKEGTYFEIRDPDGRLLTPNFMLDWGYHGEFNFWGNDCHGKPCESRTGWRSDYRVVDPGQTIAVTPSFVKPLRKNPFGRLAEARIPPGTSTDVVKSYKEYWKLQAEDLERYGAAPPGFGPDMTPQAIPGYRILEGYYFRKPGIYRMKAILDTRASFLPVSAEEEIERLRQKWWGRYLAEQDIAKIRKEWAEMTPAQLEERRKDRREREKCNREGFVDRDGILDRGLSIRDVDADLCVRIGSNVVEIEVVP